MGLTDHPVSIAAQRPARDRAHERLLARQTVDEVRHQLSEVGHHATRTACNRQQGLSVGVEPVRGSGVCVRKQILCEEADPV